MIMSKINVRYKTSKRKKNFRVSSLDRDIQETVDRLVDWALSKPAKGNERGSSTTDDPPKTISTSSNFGSSEVGPSSRPPPVSFIDLIATQDAEAHPRELALGELEEAYRAATAWNNGAGLFLTWQDKLAGPLFTSYRLLLAIIDGGTSAFHRVLLDPYFRTRKRKPSERKIALIAVEVVAKPREDSEMKACSSYAQLLERAIRLEVRLEDFVERMEAEPLRTPKPAKSTAARLNRDESGSTPLAGEDSRYPQDANPRASCSETNAILIDYSRLLDGRQDVLITARYYQDHRGQKVLEVRSVAGDLGLLD